MRKMMKVLLCGMMLLAPILVMAGSSQADKASVGLTVLWRGDSYELGQDQAGVLGLVGPDGLYVESYGALDRSATAQDIVRRAKDGSLSLDYLNELNEILGRNRQYDLNDPQVFVHLSDNNSLGVISNDSASIDWQAIAARQGWEGTNDPSEGAVRIGTETAGPYTEAGGWTIYAKGNTDLGKAFVANASTGQAYAEADSKFKATQQRISQLNAAIKELKNTKPQDDAQKKARTEAIKEKQKELKETKAHEWDDWKAAKDAADAWVNQTGTTLNLAQQNLNKVKSETNTSTWTSEQQQQFNNNQPVTAPEGQRLPEGAQAYNDALANVADAKQANENAKAAQAEVNAEEPPKGAIGANMFDPVRTVLEALVPFLTETHLSLKDDINIKAGEVGEAIGTVDSTALATDTGEDASRGRQPGVRYQEQQRW